MDQILEEAPGGRRELELKRVGEGLPAMLERLVPELDVGRVCERREAHEYEVPGRVKIGFVDRFVREDLPGVARFDPGLLAYLA